MKQASEDPLKGILGFTEDQIVTCNVKNDTQSSVFDPGTGVVLNDHLVKFIFKYGNEFGYSNMLVNYMSYMALKELESTGPVALDRTRRKRLSVGGEYIP